MSEKPSPDDVEAVARAMCRVRHLNPDDLVYLGAPVVVADTFYRAIGTPRPLWSVFADLATVGLIMGKEIYG